MSFPLRSHTHLLVVAGSRAYGVHRPESDVDVKGVAIPPAAWLHGCLRVFEQATEPDAIAAFLHDLAPEERAAAGRSKLEGTVFDLRKFLRLAAEANPNLLEVLFCRDAEVRLLTPIGRRLRDARSLFLSARCRHTFGGYAAAQLKRIETHRRWLLEPPDHGPTRAEFDLPERTVDENVLLLFDRERRYKAARTQWQQYHHWKEQRTAARAEGEARFGYDLKHGAHLYRLLKMCREILLGGEVHVWRGGRDADVVQSIRNGEWPYDRLVGWAKDADAELEEIHTSRRYVVPPTPDPDAIDALCVELVERSLTG
jgi:hypothetical protein